MQRKSLPSFVGEVAWRDLPQLLTSPEALAALRLSLVCSLSATLLVLVILAVGGGLFFGKARFEAPGPLAEEKTVIIPRGLGTRELAERFAAGPTVAYGAVRRAVAFSATHSLEESLAHEAELMSLTGTTADHAAAGEAFLLKQKPVFEGR